jgi:hypothetical protein
MPQKFAQVSVFVIHLTLKIADEIKKNLKILHWLFIGSEQITVVQCAFCSFPTF